MVFELLRRFTARGLLILLDVEDTIIDKHSPLGTGVGEVTKSFEDVFLVLPLVSIFEEIIFRLLPMFLVIYFSKRLEKRQALMVAIVSSFIFGFLHGGIFNALFIQGITGMILCLGWFKSYKISDSVILATLLTVIVHYFVNVSVLYMGKI